MLALRRVTDALPAGESRSQQAEMCASVATAIERRHHLVVQAGTGTGKSLAYLVPAVLSGQRVVVATATKALQDQLAHHDLPLLAATVGRPFTFAVLKGRSNYLCRQRAAEIVDRGLQQSLDDQEGEEVGHGQRAARSVRPSSGDGGGVDGAAPLGESGAAHQSSGRGIADEIWRILEWGEQTETGDRADLPFEPGPRSWSLLSVGPRECPGAFRCPSGSQCFAESARIEAAAADVVVVNTHLYGAHLASGGAVLPDHDVAVFDEAHELEAIMTASLGAEIGPGRMRALAGAARPLLRRRNGEDPLEPLVAVADDLRRELAGRLGARVLPDDTEPSRDDRRLAQVLELAGLRLEQLLHALRDQHEESAALPGMDEEAGRRARVLSAAGHLAEDIARLAARTSDEVAWVDGSSRVPLLRLSPIDVGPPLAERLWGDVTAVLTSATVPPGVVGRLGLDRFEVTQLNVGSPFDYQHHALLYVARHLPDRRLAASEPALHDELCTLIQAAGGRTLALFTSRRATEAAAAALRPRLDFEVLAQDDLPKGALLERFAADEASCLFATLSFWQGVDVPGRSLSLVTIDRLPFARPDDPLAQARRERAGDAAFRLVDLPRAAMLLAQGAGRLVRNATDMGVVAVLDPRLATAGYRGVLLSTLPPMRRTTDRRVVGDFLASVLTTAPEDPHAGVELSG